MYDSLSTERNEPKPNSSWLISVDKEELLLHHTVTSYHYIIPLHHTIIPLHHTITSYHYTITSYHYIIPLYHYIIPLHHTITSYHYIIPLYHYIPPSIMHVILDAMSSYEFCFRGFSVHGYTNGKKSCVTNLNSNFCQCVLTESEGVNDLHYSYQECLTRSFLLLGS